MSWLKKFLSESQSVPQQSAGGYLSHEEGTAKQQYEQFVASEIAGLERCGLPVPIFQPLSKERLEHKDGLFESGGKRQLDEIRIVVKPQFTIPPYLSFAITTLSKLDMGLRNGAVHAPPGSVRWCVLTGDTLTIQQAISVIEAEDLYTLITQYQCRWFNRDPYELHRETFWFCFPQRYKDTLKPYHWMGTKGPDYLSYNEKEDRVFNRPPLTEIEGITYDEITRIAYHYKFLGLFVPWAKTEYLLPPLTDHYSVFTVSTSLSCKYNPHAYHPRRLREINRFNRKYEAINLALPVPPPIIGETITINLLIPSQDRTATIEQFIDHIKLCQYPVTFSISAAQQMIHFAITCATVDRATLERQLSLHFPDIGIVESPPSKPPSYSAEIFLTNQYGDLKNANAFSIDPYNQLFAVLSEIDTAHAARIEIKFSPLSTQAITAVTDVFNFWSEWSKSNLFSEWKRELQKKPTLYSCTILLFASTEGILDNIINTFFRQYEEGEKVWQTTPIQTEQFARTFLSVKELAALVHFPSKEVLNRYADHLEAASMKAKLPPPLYTKDGIKIGTSEARGQIATVTLPDQIRDRHVYVIGKSGSGKSTLLLNMIAQDVARGAGVCVIDPHGDLAEAVLEYIPKERIQDTIYFNPTDPELAIPLDILSFG